MTGMTFVKHYTDPQRARGATAHWAWLAELECGIRLPELLAVEEHKLTFEYLGHQQPGPADLVDLAQALGQLHAAAFIAELGTAVLNRPHRVSPHLTIQDFVSPRRELLSRAPLSVASSPAAFYKDANIRNFLLTDRGVAIVDFDDLTLAPFGYDLAKLVVSTAMTNGRLDPRAIDDALAAYNTETANSSDRTTCQLDQLQLYAELHHQLTARYLRRNGYRYAWPDVRPWPEPEAPA
ncbi:phosphotransferase [Amycolatopsis sp. cmx-11-12]|uniref:phosphotransferase n=1 Tax=Amycolatopsis sp. cmx-11-12 TaxID=2785795 RepID=UPI003917F25C